MTAGAFDIPIHTKNISTRDFNVRPEHPAHPAHQKERPPHLSHLTNRTLPPMHGAAALLAASLTVWFALQESQTHGIRVAACIHFYVSALLPLLLYDHILAPAHSSNVWTLLVVHAGVVLFAHPDDRAVVSARLHLLVLALCLGLAYRHAHRGWEDLLALVASANSAVSLYVLSQHPESAALYYHASFVLLFAAVVLMLYAH